MWSTRWFVLVSALALPALALAEPLVQPGGKPGAARSWTAKADTLLLSLAEGLVAADVAQAIEQAAPGLKAKAEGTKVRVSGMKEKELLVALEKVDVAPPMDDVNQMFAAIQGGGGGEGEGSGSSIRATKSADFSAALKDPSAQIPATVLSVKYGDYPFVAITVRVDQAPAGGAEIGLAKGASITVVPRIRAPKGLIDRKDAQSKVNLGAWYAKAGDRVSLKLEGKTKQGFWVADRYERLPKAE